MTYITLSHARSLFKKGYYTSSAVLYSILQNRYSSNWYKTNIDLCIRRLDTCDNNASLMEVFYGASINKCYILNLTRRTDRRARMTTECFRVGIEPTFVAAIDAEKSFNVAESLRSLSLPHSIVTRFDSHLTQDYLSNLKKQMSPGAVAYKLSQRIIFQDAMTKGYQRICVFDDDVFFADFAFHRLASFLRNNDQPFKIVALGASDYTLQSSLIDIGSIQELDEVGSYTPIPGKTCGSFAMIYDRSVFQEIIEGCDEAIGTFDNSILGSIYARYPESCFVLFPNIVTPCVEESDIRASRDQYEQSCRMFWDMNNFNRWIKGSAI